MLWRRFWALYVAIGRLEAQADLRALDIATVSANPGKNGEAVRRMAQELQRRAGDHEGAKATRRVENPIVPGLTHGAMYEKKPGSIAAERERQKASAERLRREWEERRRQSP